MPLYGKLVTLVYVRASLLSDTQDTTANINNRNALVGDTNIQKTASKSGKFKMLRQVLSDGKN